MYNGGIMNTIRLKTPFEVSDIPLSEYPRPQFARDSYKTLNGWWDYAVYKSKDGFPGWQGKILVPYSPECLLSGLPEGIEVSGRRFCIGVQWHPEYTWRTVETDFTLWKSFVDACR